MDPTYPLVPIINLLAMALVLLPVATRNIRLWNIGLAVGAVSSAINCLCIAIDTIIWSNNANDNMPAWCDIVTHLMAVCGDALPASSFVLTRQLYMITCLTSVSSQQERRSHILFDLTICIILPLANLIFYYIGQSRRYVIVEEFGCSQITSSFGLPVVLVHLFGLTTSTISAIYYCHAGKFMLDNQVSRSIFIRTATMGILEVAVLFPSNVLNVVRPFLQGPVIFWPGWKVIHSSDWSTIPRYLTVEWATFGFWYTFNIKWHEWTGAAYALSFFLLFGLHAEARQNYRRSFRSICHLLGFNLQDKLTEEKLDPPPLIAAVPDIESFEA